MGLWFQGRVHMARESWQQVGQSRNRRAHIFSSKCEAGGAHQKWGEAIQSPSPPPVTCTLQRGSVTLARQRLQVEITCSNASVYGGGGWGEFLIQTSTQRKSLLFVFSLESHQHTWNAAHGLLKPRLLFQVLQWGLAAL